MAKPTPSKDYKVWLVENTKKVLINKVQRKEWWLEKQQL
jgi:hypothetical protein